MCRRSYQNKEKKTSTHEKSLSSPSSAVIRLQFLYQPGNAFLAVQSKMMNDEQSQMRIDYDRRHDFPISWPQKTNPTGKQ